MLEIEKRRGSRRTVVIVDSHRKARDFDRLANYLGDLKVETAYTIRECSGSRVKLRKKVIPQVMQTIQTQPTSLSNSAVTICQIGEILVMSS